MRAAIAGGGVRVALEDRRAPVGRLRVCAFSRTWTRLRQCDAHLAAAERRYTASCTEASDDVLDAARPRIAKASAMGERATAQ